MQSGAGNCLTERHVEPEVVNRRLQWEHEVKIKLISIIASKVKTSK